MILTFMVFFCGATETDYLIIAIREKLWVKKANNRAGRELLKLINQCLLCTACDAKFSGISV